MTQQQILLCNFVIQHIIRNTVTVWKSNTLDITKISFKYLLLKETMWDFNIIQYHRNYNNVR